MSPSKIVYRSDGGRVCRGCGHPADACACHRASERSAGGGAVRVRLDKKGRAGKSVTIVSGLPLDDDALRALGAELKRACGTGGSVKDGAIEIQGDQRQRVLAALVARGHAAKLAGG